MEKLSRRGFIRSAIAGTGGILFTYGTGRFISSWVGNYQELNAEPVDITAATDGFSSDYYQMEIPHITPEVASLGAMATPTPIRTQVHEYIKETSQTSISEPVPTFTPTPDMRERVDRFFLGQRIDLASGNPMMWYIRTNSGRIIPTSVARPYAYSVENEQAGLFDVRRHTTYTYLADGNIPVMWAHAGTYADQDLFTRQLELYLRRFEDHRANPDEIKRLVSDELIGADVLLLQAQNEDWFPQIVDGHLDTGTFQGSNLSMRIRSVVRIPRYGTDGNGNILVDSKGVPIDVVEQYSSHVMDIYPWLENHFPKAGLGNLDYSKTLGVKFCGVRLEGEKNISGIDPMQYARWFMVLEMTS